MSQSALIIVDNHGEMEYYYHRDNGSIDVLGVEICLYLHEPAYFYSAGKNDWKDGFSDYFGEEGYQRYKMIPLNLKNISSVYYIKFGKEDITVDFYTGFIGLKDWRKGQKQRIFQTDFLTGYKSRLRTLCVENF